MNKGLYLFIVPIAFALLIFSIGFNKSEGKHRIIKTEAVSTKEDNDFVRYLSSGAIYPVKTFVVGEYDISAVRLGADFAPSDEEIGKLVGILSRARMPNKLISGTIFVFSAGNDFSKKIFLKHGENISGFDLKIEEHVGKKGLYFRASGGRPIVVIKNLNEDNEDNVGTVLHEVGHRLGDELTKEEWREYYELRSISADFPRYIDTWDTSPNEDFAEVYRYVAMKYWLGMDPSNIKTRYGTLLPHGEDTVCKSIEEQSRLQDCRRYVRANPDIYPTEEHKYVEEKEVELVDFLKRVILRVGA